MVQFCYADEMKNDSLKRNLSHYTAMEYDIDISEYIIKNGKYTRKCIVDETYLSYNWSDFSEICSQHPLEEKCECQKTHLWYFRNDCHGRRGDDVKDRAQKALDILKGYGIVPGTPDISNSSWGWGLTNGRQQLPQKERLGVFAYHLKRFRDLGSKYDWCYFIGDHDDDPELIIPDGAVIKDEEREVINGPVTYFRHPFKGNFRIDSFKTSMEIFGLLSAQGSEHAQMWYDLALQMPDVPGK
jgi:hypothetical protein